jgi:hypothetical protein
MTIVNKTMPALVAILSAALLTMSLVVSNIPLAVAHGSHAHAKQPSVNQGIKQLNQCMHDVACWNYAQNLLCGYGATCIFGPLTPFLMPWQKTIVH